MTDKPTPTTDLLKRCAEIHEWRSTGVLSGEALRDYAKRKWPDRHDTLQMAEHETVTEALALLAKWGQPAQAEAPVAYSIGNTLKWHEGKGLTNAQLYTAPQPVEREPLTNAQREKIIEAVDWYNFPQDVIDAVERAHGIKGGQHG